MQYILAYLLHRKKNMANIIIAAALRPSPTDKPTASLTV